LPNIQGQIVNAPLPDGARNKNFGFKYLGFWPSINEAILIP
jgi:hypothetical protein